MKKLLTVLVALCLGLVAKAEPTDLSQYDNLVYAQEITAQAGSTATLSIQMKNTASVIGWQFDMLLPDGVTFAKDAEGNEQINLSLERTTAAKHNMFEHAKQKDGYMRVLCASTTNALFSGTEGEVATMQLNIDENLAPGDYYIKMKEIVMSAKLAAGEYKTYDIDSIVTKLTVVLSPIFDKGYVVNIAPLTLDATGGGSVTGDIYFNVASDVAQGNTVDFDVQFPKEWFDNYMLADVVKNSALSTRYYTVSDPTDNKDGSWHFTLTAKAASKYFGKVESTKIGSFTIYQDGGGDDETYAIPEGIYPIIVKNVVMKDADGIVYKPANTSTIVTVGTPTEAEVSLDGLLTQEVCDALDASDGLKKLDFSNVVAIEGNLTLKDGCGFIAPKAAVTVPEVSYQRTVKNQWGTLCVPFELTSDATTQYYKLKSVSTNSMLFAPVATVEAGIPVVFKTTGTLVSASAKDVELKTNNVAETDAAGWMMNGTYEAKTINPTEESNDIYYISENQFVYGDVAFPVPAYRGYFETSKGGVAKAFSYNIDAEKGNDTTGIGYMENEDGTVTVTYDLNGIKQSKPNRGLNIINGKKVIVK